MVFKEMYTYLFPEFSQKLDHFDSLDLPILKWALLDNNDAEKQTKFAVQL